MRSQNNVVELGENTFKRIAVLSRFYRVNVTGGTANLAGFKSCCKSNNINIYTSLKIQEDYAVLHLGK